jgi:hypothetical protein
MGTNAMRVCVIVLVAMVAYGCSPDVPASERKFAADGQFWAGLEVDTGALQAVTGIRSWSAKHILS